MKTQLTCFAVKSSKPGCAVAVVSTLFVNTQGVILTEVSFTFI